MRKSESINDALKPDGKLVKTAANGQVFYEDVNFMFLSGEDMKAAGIMLAQAFSDYEIWVTGGPWRGYDVKYDVDMKAKIILLDFYSPRPGLRFMKDVITEIRAKLDEKPKVNDDV